MDIQGTMGGLIPAWIIGAPLLAGLISLFATPKTSARTTNDHEMRFKSGTPASPANMAGARA